MWPGRRSRFDGREVSNARADSCGGLGWRRRELRGGVLPHLYGADGLVSVEGKGV